ncbi:MAG: 23S rRNA (guanosine(2251)-2'-O)-methyltransferase RlmB [Nitrospinota bacterium]
MEQKKYRSKHRVEQQVNITNSEYLYGINPILEALKAKKRKFYTIYIPTGKKSKQLSMIFDLASSRKIQIKSVTPSTLKNLVKLEKFQNVVAHVSKFKYGNFEKLVGKLAIATQPVFILIIDGVTDPRNLGGIIRSAEAFGAVGILFSSRNRASYTPVAAKTSAGGGEHLPLFEVQSLKQAIELLKSKANMKIIGFENCYEPLNTLPSGNIGLIFGDEGSGISKPVLEKADAIYAIPTVGKVNSINVSTAVAIGSYLAHIRLSKI